MKVSRKKFFISLSTAMIAGVSVFSNPVKLLLGGKKISEKILVKENPYAVKRNPTGAVNG